MNTYADFAKEEWKTLNLGEGFINDIRLEISTWGRIRSFNKINNGKLLNGSLVNGYLIIRQRFFVPRTTQTDEKLAVLKAPVLACTDRITAINKLLRKKQLPDVKSELCQKLEEEKITLASLKKIYNHAYHKDVKKRTTYFAGLIHRLVAVSFLEKTSPDQTLVAHLDYDKLNNKLTNLKWMNVADNAAHQQKSPRVMEERKKRKQSGLYQAANYKLTVTKVMFLKKLLNEGKSIRSLAKQFKVTETQINNIKKEVNWGSVEAAK